MGKFKELKVDIAVSANAILGKYFPAHIVANQNAPSKTANSLEIGTQEAEKENAASK